MKKNLIIVTMIVVLLASAIYYKWPVTIEREFAGELHRNQHITPAIIFMNMKLNRNFLSENKISGTVVVGDKEYNVYDRLENPKLFYDFSNIRPIRKFSNIINDKDYSLSDIHYSGYLNRLTLTIDIQISRDFTSISGFISEGEDSFTGFLAPVDQWN